jgi:acetyl esterase/lipase
MREDLLMQTRSVRRPDEVVSYGPEAEQIAEIFYASERATPLPLVLLIHGGFWRPAIDRAHARPMAAALAKAGRTVAAIEYRRVPQHPELTVDDVALSLELVPGSVANHDGRVLVLGHSAGGHLALWAASKRPVPQLNGALALAPVADLQLACELNLGEGAALAFLGQQPGARADLDPKRMQSPAIPTTIVHGDADEVVPLSVSESYVAAHPEVRLVKPRGGGHFDVIDPASQAWRIVLAELELLAQ